MIQCSIVGRSFTRGAQLLREVRYYCCDACAH